MAAEPDAQAPEASEARAKAYHTLRRRLWFLSLLGSTALLAIVALAGPGVWLRDRVAALGWPWPVEVFVYYVIGLVGYEVLMLPLGYVRGFVVPRRFGVSHQPLRGWVRDQAVGLALGLALGGALLVGLNGVMRWQPDWWWLPAGVGLLLVTVALAQLAPILLVPLFYKLEPITDQALTDQLTRLAERAGARLRGVYRMRLSDRTRGANAALMGLGSTRRVALSDTMLSNYSPDEIETVIAHELAHHVHHDIPVGIAAQSIVTLGGFWLTAQILDRLGPSLGLVGPFDLAALPLLALTLGLYSAITSPILNTLTRWAEVRADAWAVRATNNPQAFISALERLSADNLAERHPPAWAEILLHDHPSIGRRIANASAQGAALNRSGAAG